MPEPPSVGFFTQYVLENPYPISGLLIVLAGILVWMSIRDGQMKWMKMGLVAALAAAALVVTGVMVVTAAEHAKNVARTLVDAATAGDVSLAMNQFTDDAVMSFGSVNNPGMDVDFIMRQLSLVVDRYPIETSRISSLKGYSESSDRATVHLTCWAEVKGGYGPTPSQWVLSIERQDDDVWKIRRLTSISIAGRPTSQRDGWVR